MSRRRWGLLLTLALAALLVAGRVVAGWIVDYRWFEALDATDLFRAKALNLGLLRACAFVVGTLVVFANLYAVRHSVAAVILPRRVGNLEIGEELPSRYLFWTIALLAVVLGGALAVPEGDWMALELVRHGEPFREADPYFQVDLAFWLYWLPLERGVHVWALAALLGTTLLVTFLYALTPSLRWERGRLRMTGHVRRHLAVLGALFLLMLAWSYRLDAYRLLLEGSGDGGVFVHLDHRVGIPANLVLAMASVVAAMLLGWSGWVGQWRLAGGTLLGVLILSLSLRFLLPGVTGRVVTPSEASRRDRPYLATRAAFSRRAFDADRVGDVGPRGPIRNGAPAAGAAVWDLEAIQRAVSFLRQPGRPLGTVGWMVIDGRPHALVVEQPGGPTGADVRARWSLTLVDAGATGEGGGLLRPAERNDALQRIPPVIVGDPAGGSGLVVDSTGHLAAPALERTSDRIAHAWGLQNPRLLRPSGAGAPVRLVRFRGVRERVERLFPFFAQGNRVVPLVIRDSLYWAVHLYASSAAYPLSDPIVTTAEDVRYFRHAAMALVNAHSGRTVAIRTPAPDPIARSWFARFPSMFVPATSLGEETLRQLPPANDGVLAQARIFARYGRRGDAAPPSHIARETGSDTLFKYPGLAPYYDPARQRLALAYPILDAASTLRGAIVGVGGAENVTEWLPLDSLTRRWSDGLDAMRQALDSVAGGAQGPEQHLIRGPVRAFVSQGTVALIQTAYDWRADGPPAARWSVVQVGDSLRVERSVVATLDGPARTDPERPLSPEDFRQRVALLYRQMSDALSRNDLTQFGVAYDALGKLLRGVPPP